MIKIILSILVIALMFTGCNTDKKKIDRLENEITVLIKENEKLSANSKEIKTLLADLGMTINDLKIVREVNRTYNSKKLKAECKSKNPYFSLYVDEIKEFESVCNEKFGVFYRMANDKK